VHAAWASGFNFYCSLCILLYDNFKPSLRLSMNLLDKVTALEVEAADFGFRWERPEQILKQIKSECQEIEEHLHQSSATDALQEEIGDLLHAVFSLCVFCKFDPELTLAQTLAKFERRLGAVKLIAKQEGLADLEGQSFAALMRIWDKAKLLVG
jgi:uncharacterized protein YabN with tetrapyrrole methylase and pyrophosphatase domain